MWLLVLIHFIACYLFHSPTVFITRFLILVSIYNVIPISFSYSSRDSWNLFLFIIWYLFPSPIHHVILGTCSCSSCDTYFLLLFIMWLLVLVHVPVHHVIPISFSNSSRDSFFLCLLIMCSLFPSPIHHLIHIFMMKTLAPAPRPDLSPVCHLFPLWAGRTFNLCFLEFENKHLIDFRTNVSFPSIKLSKSAKSSNIYGYLTQKIFKSHNLGIKKPRSWHRFKNKSIGYFKCSKNRKQTFQFFSFFTLFSSFCFYLFCRDLFKIWRFLR